MPPPRVSGAKASQVAGVYRIAAYAPNQQPGRQLSRTVRLTPASLDLLRRIGDGELAEFAVTAAGIAFLLWKYFRIPVTVLGTPALAAHPSARRHRAADHRGPSTSASRTTCRAWPRSWKTATPSLTSRLKRSCATRDMALAQLTKVALADDRVHHAPTGRDDDLQLHLRLARGEIELRYSAAIEPFIIDGFAGSLGAVLAAFEHLDTPVGDIASAPPEDGPLLAAFNETATTGPSHPTVVAMFKRRSPARRRRQRWSPTVR